MNSVFIIGLICWSFLFVVISAGITTAIIRSRKKKKKDKRKYK